MPHIQNRTPFEADVISGVDKEGREYAVAVIKATFDIKGNGNSLPVSEKQAPIQHEDTYYGKPGESSIKYCSDSPLVKRGCDIALIGFAYSDMNSRKAIEVSLEVGSISKTVRVFGDRRWYRSFLGSWKISEPSAFDRMPLVYERAFGGTDSSHANPTRHGVERRNPVGTGFCVSGGREYLETLPLPNIENTRQVIRKWKDKPVPAGFGFIGSQWVPRVNYGGTYDEKWSRERSPLLPVNFDDRFFNCAAPDLIAPDYLSGGEPVRVVNASSSGTVSFKLPVVSFEVSVWLKGSNTVYTPRLDTVIIEPDEKRVIMAWRATIPCSREFQYIQSVSIDRK